MNPSDADAPLEFVTVNSEISMSVVTDVDVRRRRSILRRLAVNQEMDAVERRKCCSAPNAEPVILLVAISLGLLLTSQPLFMYWARCVEIVEAKFPDEQNVTSLCSTLTANNNTDLQDIVEKDISTMKIYLQIAASIPTLIVAPLVGEWSDKTGRKLPLVFALFGYTLYSVFNFVATLTYDRFNVYSWLMLSEISLGLAGGAGTLFTTMFSIVTDQSRHKMRPGSSSVPMRIGVASSLQSGGTLLGTLAVSYLSVPAMVDITRHGQSYVHSAALQLVFAVAAFAYCLICVSETHFPKKNRPDDTGLIAGDDASAADCCSPAAFMKHVCSIVQVVAQKRAGWTRLCLCLCLLFVFVEFLALDQGLLILLVKREPFDWNDSLFSVYSVTRGLCFSLGMVICPLLLSKSSFLGKDSILIVIGSSAASVSFFFIATATTTYQIFASAPLALLIGSLAPGFRSFLPRMVPKEQTARLFTVMGIVMAITPIISAIVFNNLFNWSIDFWPGFAFAIGGVLLAVAALGQMLIYYLMHPLWKSDREQRNESVRAPGSEDSDVHSISSNVIEHDDRRPFVHA